QLDLGNVCCWDAHRCKSQKHRKRHVTKGFARTLGAGRECERGGRRDRAASTSRQASMGSFEPSIDLAFSLVLGVAVALLQPAGKFFSLSLDDVDCIVGE